MGDPVEAEIRRVLSQVGRLSIEIDELDDHSDLYAAGMSSHAAVDVMLALEETFEIEFPSAMLKRGTFESIVAIATAVTELRAQAA